MNNQKEKAPSPWHAVFAGLFIVCFLTLDRPRQTLAKPLFTNSYKHPNTRIRKGSFSHHFTFAWQPTMVVFCSLHFPGEASFYSAEMKSSECNHFVSVPSKRSGCINECTKFPRHRRRSWYINCCISESESTRTRTKESNQNKTCLPYFGVGIDSIAVSVFADIFIELTNTVIQYQTARSK